MVAKSDGYAGYCDTRSNLGVKFMGRRKEIVEMPPQDNPDQPATQGRLILSINDQLKKRRRALRSVFSEQESA